MIKKYIIRALFSVALLSLSHFVFANVTKDKIIPTVCPSAAYIKATTFDVIKQGRYSNLWIAMQSHQKYDTSGDWTFIFELQADDKEEAYRKANDALRTLKLMEGPSGMDYVWFCQYQSDQPVFSAIAMTTAT